MKKIVPYFLTSLFTLIVVIVITNFCKISTQNTWFGLVGAIAVFIPIFIWGFRFSKEIRHKRPFLFYIIRFCIFIGILAGIINIIAFIVTSIVK